MFTSQPGSLNLEAMLDLDIRIICAPESEFSWDFNKISTQRTSHEWFKVKYYISTYLSRTILNTRCLRSFLFLQQLETFTVIVKARNTFTLLYWKNYILICRIIFYLKKYQLFEKRCLFLWLIAPNAIFYSKEGFSKSLNWVYWKKE